MIKKMKWISAAALTLSASTLVATPAMADYRDWGRDWNRDRDYRHYDHDGRYGRDVDREISLSEVPRDVRRTMDRELGRLQRRIEHVWFVRRDGKEFYRVQVDRRGDDDLSFRISPDGRLLSVQEVNDRWSR